MALREIHLSPTSGTAAARAGVEKESLVQYSLLERLFRVCVFRLGVYSKGYGRFFGVFSLRRRSPSEEVC